MSSLLPFDIDNLTETERIILNSLIVGGIAFFSSLTVTGLPTIANVWSAFIGASLSGLTQLLALTRRQENIQKDYRKKPPLLGMLI